MTWFRTGWCLAVMAWALSMHAPPVRAADNAALGGVRGIDNGTLLGGDGTGTARFSLFAVELALVKQARDPAGNVLPDGTDVAPTDEIYFVLYVDNPTAAAATDLQITDLLDESQFSYVPNSLEQTLVASGSGNAAIWAGSWTTLTDGVGPPDDGGSVTDTGGPPGADRLTLGAVTGQVNQLVDVPAMSLRAIRFRVRVE